MLSNSSSHSSIAPLPLDLFGTTPGSPVTRNENIRIEMHADPTKTAEEKVDSP
jgi:hypothetical protein